MTLTVGSLFSGIGGLELGLEKTGGFKTIWNCEVDEYASAILRKHWPEVPNIGDITKADWPAMLKPDVICGGFPCQDISVAGKGAGIKEGTRSGLWFEYARAIRALRPRYVIVENVPMLVKRGLHIVLADLTEAGYDAEWHNIAASAVGAWHRRERIFIIAHPMRGGCNAGSDIRQERPVLPTEKRSIEKESAERNRWLGGVGENGSDVPDTSLTRLERSEETRNPCGSWENTGQLITRHGELNKSGIWATEPDVGGTLDGFSTWLDKSEEGKQMIINTHKRVIAYGNANKTSAEEVLRLLRSGYGTQEDRKQAGGQRGISSEEVLLTYLCQLTQASKALDNLPLQSAEVQEEELRSLRSNNKPSRTSYRPRSKEQHTGKHPDVVRILPQLLALDAEEAWCAFRNENAATRHFYWESGIARVAYGVPSRMDRIKCLGNAVVPQVAQVGGEIILEMEKEREMEIRKKAARSMERIRQERRGEFSFMARMVQGME